MEQIVADIKKVPNVYLRIIFGFGMIVISTLFGMYIKSEGGTAKAKDDTIKSQSETIIGLRKELKDCNDARYNDKENEYQRVLRRQVYSDSIDAITKSIKEKLGIK